MAWDTAATLAVLSGIALALLGMGVAFQRPRRSATLLFAAFAVAWGGQVVTANLARATDDASWFWLSLAFVPAITLFLAGFVVAYPTRWSGRAAQAVAGSFVAVATVALVVFLVSPRSIFQGFGSPEEGSPVRFGWLAPILIMGPFYLGFAVAILRFLRLRSTAQGAVPQVRWLLGGLLLFVSYVNVRNLAQLATFPAYREGLTTPLLASFVAIYAVGLVVALVAALAVGGLLRGEPDRFLFACAVVPGLVAAAEWALNAGGVGAIETLGLWRLSTVALVAYGIVRFQLFDIDLRIKWGLSRGVVAACIAGAFFVGTHLLENVVTFNINDTVLGIVAAGAIALAARPLHRLAIRLVDKALPSVQASHQYIRRRKLEVYHLAVAQALARGGDRPDPFLGHLSETLGLSELEQRTAEHAARAGHGRPVRSKRRPVPA